MGTVPLEVTGHADSAAGNRKCVQLSVSSVGP
jgi:hypothetical protein